MAPASWWPASNQHTTQTRSQRGRRGATMPWCEHEPQGRLLVSWFLPVAGGHAMACHGWHLSAAGGRLGCRRFCGRCAAGAWLSWHSACCRWTAWWQPAGLLYTAALASQNGMLALTKHLCSTGVAATVRQRQSFRPHTQKHRTNSSLASSFRALSSTAACSLLPLPAVSNL